MTLEDLGNIGEFVGAIGVVVSLLYLAIQIRRSNLLSAAESNRFGQHAPIEPIMAIVQDPEVARIFREGLGDRLGGRPKPAIDGHLKSGHRS